jgi:hypothetical protein
MAVVSAAGCGGVSMPLGKTGGGGAGGKVAGSSGAAGGGGAAGETASGGSAGSDGGAAGAAGAADAAGGSAGNVGAGGAGGGGAGSGGGTAGAASGTAGGGGGTAGAGGAGGVGGAAGSTAGAGGGTAGAGGAGGVGGAAGSVAGGGGGTAGGAGGVGGAAGSVAGAGGGTAGAGGAGGVGGAGGAFPCPVGVLGHCSAETGAVDKYAGYTLALAEEFDQAIDLDNDPIWTWSDGGPAEAQSRFQKKGITFANGTMMITATAETVPSSTSYAEPNQNQTTGTVHQCAVSSGELRTKYNNYRYGRYEVKLTAPTENPGGADGNYLSTLFVFRTPKWQEWNEIDIELEANIKGRVAWNMINALGRTAYPSDKADAGSGMVPGVTGFDITTSHVYAFEWQPTKVVWYADGVVIRSDSGGLAAVPTMSTKIMMNLWVFASAAAFGDPANNKYPFHATYDYFRFYKWKMETTYPCSPIPSCLPSSDLDFSRNNPNETNYGQ